MSTPYVKFFRGTPTAFEKLTNKNKDTLYFISASDEKMGKLYLGDKLISDNINSVADLEDILLSNLSNNQILTYDSSQKKWINKAILDAIGLFGSATEISQGSNGLVPAPGAGMQNAFLRGDGQWAFIEENNLEADEQSISILNKEITLKDYGIKYYKFIPKVNDIEAHYEIQEVNKDYPWKENLEPRVVLENNELVLGWFEPNNTKFDEIENQISTISNSIDYLEEELDKKANIVDVYTKSETIERIQQAISTAEHMSRKKFENFEEAKKFANSDGINANNYIYIINNGSNTLENKYNEYLYIDGNFELIGSWEVELSDYATKEELENKVDKILGKSLVSDEEINKLSTVKEGAEPNFISSVNTEELEVNNGKLNILSINTNKVKNLDSLLNEKATKESVEALTKETSRLNGIIGSVNTRVTNIEYSLENFVTINDFTTEINAIKEAITWKNLME